MKISDYKKYNSKYRINKIKERNFKFLAYNSSSEFTIFNKDLEQILDISLSEFIDIDFIPNKKQILYSTKKCVKIIDYKENEIKTIDVKNAKIHIQDENLWLASMINDDYIEVSLFNISDFSKITSIKIKDENYFSASVSIYSAFDKNILLWVAQGQDGYWNVLLKLTNNKLSFEYLGDDFIYPITFSKSSKQILMVDEDYIDVLSYPDEDIITNLELDDYDFVNDYSFITETKILFLAENGLFIYDIQLEKTEKIILKNINKEILNSEDFNYFKIVNNTIFLCYDNDKEKGILEIDINIILEN